MESASSSRSAITPSPSFLATPDSDDNLAGDKPDASLPMLHLDDDAHSTDGESDDGLLERGSIPLHALDGHGAATTHPEREGLLNDEDADDVVYNAFRGVNESSNTTRRKPRRPRLLLYSSEQEKKVVTRLDRYLVGGLALLYMLSFLDRSNIGNAYIAGMKEDLKLTGDRYEWLLMAFYITYIAFEWMTLCWKMFPAHAYVSVCVAGWGVVASLQAVVPNWEWMLVCRALLGITEAAFGPGVPFYLSLFYRREELALRTGLFISSAPLATAYAGFLAYGITSIPSSIASWRLLYVIEGFPSVVAAIIAFYWIPDAPSDCRFLDHNQKRIAHQRVLVVHDHDPSPGIRWADVRIALGDAGNWITALLLFSVNTSFASLPVFLPTIIHEFGYTTTAAQALSIPPYLFAFVVILVMTWASDRVRSRSWFIMGLAFMSASGYLLLAGAGHLQLSIAAAAESIDALEASNGLWTHLQLNFLTNHNLIALKYTGVMLAAGAIFSLIALIIVWNGNNNESESGRGTGIAVLQALGQCGSLLGTRFYPHRDAPKYISGSIICAGFMVAAMVLTAAQRLRLQRLNRTAERSERRQVAEGTGEGKVGWRFML